MKVAFQSFLAAALANSVVAVGPSPFRLDAAVESDMPLLSSSQSCQIGGDDGPSARGGAVYSQTNQPDNEVLVFFRDPSDGTLTYAGAVITGGSGSMASGITGPPANIAATPEFLVGDPITTQGSVHVAGDCLLVTNAGSNEVSSFQINPASGWIELAGVYPSGGFFPGSVAAQGEFVYVANLDGNGSIKGFRLSQRTCELEDIEGAIVELTMQGGGPNSDEVSPQFPAFHFSSIPQVSFAPDGNLVLFIRCMGGGQNQLAETCVSSIIVFEVDSHTGMVSYPVMAEVTGTGFNVPFGFDYDDNGRILLAILSGSTNGDGGLAVLEKNGEGSYDTVDVFNNQQAFTKLIAYNRQNSCTYVSSSIPGLNAFTTENGIEQVSQAIPQVFGALDLALSEDGQYIYTVVALDVTGGGQPQIRVHKTDCECGLEQIQVITEGVPSEAERVARDGLLNGMVGMAAYPSHPAAASTATNSSRSSRPTSKSRKSAR